MLEKYVEDHLVKQVQMRGGTCVKLNPKGYKGIPDRLVLMPGGRVMFVELKRPKGGVVAALQDWWHELLLGLGMEVHVVNTFDEVDALFTVSAGRSR